MELMLAVAVLVVVILATAKIFSTVSKVASIGEGAIEVMQDVGAVQRQIQSDLADLAPEGFFAIRCVAVRNNINQTIPLLNPSAPLLNPGLADDAWIRADQLMFFTNAPRSSKEFVGSTDLQAVGAPANAYSAISRVYYGHGFQLFPAVEGLSQTCNAAIGFDSGAGVFPWSYDPVSGGSLNWTTVSGAPQPDPIVGSQPPAPKWILTRQTVLLADDGGDEHFFFSSVANSVPDIWDFGLRNSRFDIAARQLNDIRRTILFNSTTSTPRPWRTEQRNMIGDAMAYPRVERQSYTMDRVDQLLTASALAGACSSFIVDWTYDATTGEATNQLGRTFNGVYVQPGEQPWFGLDTLSGGGLATGDFPGVRGVQTFTGYVHKLGILSLPQPETIDLGATLQITPPVDNDIERMLNPPVIHMLGMAFGVAGAPIRVYEAIFGFNHNDAINPMALTGLPAMAGSPAVPPLTIPYTPWPSAIRITMTLHDSNTRLETGREVQFVLHLPRRGG